MGRLADGWRDYEWRFITPQVPVDVHPYALPFWKGEDLAGKGLLIWCEQGVGDEIVFASMISGVAAQAKKCVLQTTPRLAPLFARSFPNVEVYGGPVPAAIVQTLNVQSSMGSLGQWRRPSFGSFPAASDYLKAEPGRTAALRAKYTGGRSHSLVVGLAWRSANVTDAAEKTVGLNQWGAVLNVPGVTFVNLQYGDTREDRAAAQANFGVTIIDDPEVDALTDLDGFAAQVAAMDLVISSSNTAAHIAGAVGVPTFCMVPRALGSGRRWYWFGEGRASPWYRSMTVFRQTQPAWTDVLAEVGLALVDAAASAGVLDQPAHFLERLARGYLSAGMTAEAEKTYDQALLYAPSSVPLLREAANLKLKRGAPAEALPLVERAIAQEPDSPEPHNMHGMILARLQRLGDAASAYRRAIAQAPAQAEFYNNLGTALRRAGHNLEACEVYTEAHRLKPDHPSILLNYAMALSEINKLAEALTSLNDLITLKPDYVDAHYNRALVLMALGQLEDGWREFTWRMKRSQVHVRHEDFPQPVWSGEPLADKHILVWTDLGLGDEILAASIIPDLAATARRVTLLCSARLVPLMRRSFPSVTVDTRAAPLPAAAVSKDIDLQMSIAELGIVFRKGFDEFPERQTFLVVDANTRDALRAKYLAGRTARPLVGISWRSINPEIGAQKSVPLAAWLPILKVPGVTFVNLQYGDCSEEIESLRRDHGVDIINDADINTLGDMDPVAAQTAAMDLVISISNTTVHLAGGAGIPTWVLLPKGHARLWYWFRGLERCAWHPSVMLLTSPDEGDWSRLIAHCAADLQRRTAASS